jgi:hypothetical protein
VRLTSVSLGYDIAHMTASGFSPLLATLLAQKLNPTAPGILYTFYALIAFLGMMISTQIHYDDTNETSNNNTNNDAGEVVETDFEQEPSSKDQTDSVDAAVPAQSEPAVNPIV